MNPCLILTRNNLSLTKRCVESIKNQDIETLIILFDNGSTDGTTQWIVGQQGILSTLVPTNIGVSAAWNQGLGMLFDLGREDHCLVVNNDTVLPPWFYRELLSYNEPFVSGVSVDQMSQIESLPPRCPLVTHPDFSGFLIRRECWERVGPFDERMKLYASDNDWHVRAHRAGVRLWKANVPFYHERSSTLNNASPEERAEIQRQADADRAVFQSIYGCKPWEKAYEELFK